LAKGDERIALFSWNETEPPSPSLLAEFDSVVLLKVASGLPQAVTALRQAGMLEQSLLVSNCGRSAEEISSDLEGAARREAHPYLSLILARRRKEQ
jgi:precorrin-2 methylase